MLDDPNVPTTDQKYLAAIAFEVAKANTRYKNPNKFKVEDFYLKFGPAKSSKLSREEKIARSKAHWFAVTGLGKARKKNIPKYVKGIKR